MTVQTKDRTYEGQDIRRTGHTKDRTNEGQVKLKTGQIKCRTNEEWDKKDRTNEG